MNCNPTHARGRRLDASDLDGFAARIGSGGVVALTGAGVSTDSGIPDYRDDDGSWKHKRPLDFKDFIASEAVRRRYWARSVVGYERLRAAAPNAAHLALTEFQSRGLCSHIITQNVDGLHQRAGSRSVTDLHGRMDRVVCLDCAARYPRDEIQQELVVANPGWRETRGADTPDGDAELGSVDYDAFQLVACPRCRGMLKPDVVFFGEHVDASRVVECQRAVDAAGCLLIVGTSLMVFSGYRFARQAQRRGVPLLIINRGRTRADDAATLKLSGNAGALLSGLLARL